MSEMTATAPTPASAPSSSTHPAHSTTTAATPTTAQTQSPPAAAAAATLPTPTPTPRKNVVRLCGASWAPCGYCKGSRAHFSKMETSTCNDGSNGAATTTTTTPTNTATVVSTSTSSATSEVESSKAYSVVASHLTPALYEQCLESGWRRSGVALYKPLNCESCCPALTIRLAVDRYQPTKSQTKVAKRMKSLLMTPSSAPLTTKSPAIQPMALESPTDAVANVVSSQGKRMKTASRREREKATPSSRDASVEATLNHSGILERLCAETRSCLLRFASPQSTLETTPIILPTIRYKIKAAAPRQYDNLKPRHDNGITSTTKTNCETRRINVFTTVCAAVAGQSHGQWDRATLSRTVATALRDHFVATTTPPPRPDINLTINTNGAHNGAHSEQVQVASVQAHEESGQVIVQLIIVLPPTMGDAHVNGANGIHSNGGNGISSIDSRYAAMNGSQSEYGQPSSAIKQPDVKSMPDDRFRAWWLSNQQPQQQQPGIVPPLPPYQLSVSTVSAHESALDPRVHQLYWDYQHVVHNDANPLHHIAEAPEASENLDPTTSDAAAILEFKLDGGNPSNPAWGIEYAPAGWRDRALTMLSNEYGHLPERKQKRLIRSYASFYEFLVESPLRVPTDTKHEPTKASNGNSNAKPLLGTYHQHYTMSGDVLVAVGVVDILPSGLSSVYLFYSPSFAHKLVPLGKLAILKEIEWTKQARLPNYYLGYYIESCPKMVYKADYRPSELLCPTTNRWVPAEEGIATLRKDSPEHHCCTLYKGADTVAVVESTNETESLVSNDADKTESKASKAISAIQMDVGVPSLVSLSMLHPDGQALVRPFLVDFVDQSGPEIAVQCTVSFR